MSTVLASCSGLSQSSNPTPTVPIAGGTASQTQVALTSLHWCGKPLVLFEDEGGSKSSTPGATATLATTPTTPTTATTPTIQSSPKAVTNWSQVEPNLGFTVYLPQELPAGTCLTSAYGTFHDPVLGGSFTIGYLLPDHTAISFSETPLASQNVQFQCSISNGTNGTGGTSGTGKTSVTPTPGATATPLQVCTGARGSTSIVLLAHGDTGTLQKFFNALQPHVNWQPAS